MSRTLFGRKIFPKSRRIFQGANQWTLKKEEAPYWDFVGFDDIAKQSGYWAAHILKTLKTKWLRKKYMAKVTWHLPLVTPCGKNFAWRCNWITLQRSLQSKSEQEHWGWNGKTCRQGHYPGSQRTNYAIYQLKYPGQATQPLCNRRELDKINDYKASPPSPAVPL